MGTGVQHAARERLHANPRTDRVLPLAGGGHHRCFGGAAAHWRVSSHAEEFGQNCEAPRLLEKRVFVCLYALYINIHLSEFV